MNKRKICVITGSRAEYGLLKSLMREIRSDSALQLQIVAAASHFSREHGLTYVEIEADGFTIDERVENLSGSDSSSGASYSIGLGFILFSRAFEKLCPDIIVVLGDRYELLAAVGSALMHGIPVAHIHGGEVTEGVFDEQIRHALTKMSHIHFVATEEYRKRVIQLGEEPCRVLNSGSPALDDIVSTRYLSRSEFENKIGFKLGSKNLLVTFHPETASRGLSQSYFVELLKAFDSLRELKIIFTHPNADPEGLSLSHMIKEYLSHNPGKGILVPSMGRGLYLSAIKLCDAVVGNSSSGIIEAPSFRKGTINVGTRQNGRIKAASIIDCEPVQNSIISAIRKLYSKDFQSRLKNVVNPYGKPGASKYIKETLKEIDVFAVRNKKFYDLKF